MLKVKSWMIKKILTNRNLNSTERIIAELRKLLRNRTIQDSDRRLLGLFFPSYYMVDEEDTELEATALSNSLRRELRAILPQEIIDIVISAFTGEESVTSSIIGDTLIQTPIHSEYICAFCMQFLSPDQIIDGRSICCNSEVVSSLEQAM